MKFLFVLLVCMVLSALLEVIYGEESYEPPPPPPRAQLPNYIALPVLGVLILIFVLVL